MISLGLYFEEVELAKVHHCLFTAIRALMQPERDYDTALKYLRIARQIVAEHSKLED